jgi:hypothetical protein
MLTLGACSALAPPPTPVAGTLAPAATLPPPWTATARAGVSPSPSPSLAEKTEALAPTATPSLFHVASAEEAQLALDTSSVRMLNRIMSADRSLTLLEPEPLLWGGSWCAASQEILEQNFAVMETLLFAGGFEIDPTLYATNDYGSHDPENLTFCRGHYVLIDSWPYGLTFLEVRHVIRERLNDGWDEYQPDTLVTRFVVYVGATGPSAGGQEVAGLATAR